MCIITNMKWISLLLGGIAGTAARYVLAGAVLRTFGSRFPYGTLAVNLSGCFVLGFFAAFMEERAIGSQELRLLLLIGFCGAYTTFSTWILETDLLMREGQAVLAWINVLGSFVGGFLLFRAGILIGKII